MTPPELHVMLTNQHIMTQRSPANQVSEAESVDVEARCQMYMTLLPLNMANSTNHGHGVNRMGS